MDLVDLAVASPCFNCQTKTCSCQDELKLFKSERENKKLEKEKQQEEIRSKVLLQLSLTMEARKAKALVENIKYIQAEESATKIYAEIAKIRHEYVEEKCRYDNEIAGLSLRVRMISDAFNTKVKPLYEIAAECEKQYVGLRTCCRCLLYQSKDYFYSGHDTNDVCHTCDRLTCACGNNMPLAQYKVYLKDNIDKPIKYCSATCKTLRSEIAGGEKFMTMVDLL